MSYSTLPTKSKLARELDRTSAGDLGQWLLDNAELVEFLSERQCDRGAHTLLSAIEGDREHGSPRATTIMMLAEFRRALLQ